jgi:hypothetical protein
VLHPSHVVALREVLTGVGAWVIIY